MSYRRPRVTLLHGAEGKPGQGRIRHKQRSPHPAGGRLDLERIREGIALTSHRLMPLMVLLQNLAN